MTATLTEAPELRGSRQVRGRRLVVWFGVLLPFAYATWWFGAAAHELRDYGHDVRDARLAALSKGRTTAGMLAGWILVVPAVVVMLNTARRVQHAERIRSGTPRSVSGVVAVVLAGQAAVLVTVLAGWAILMPAVLLVSAVAVMGLLQPRLNAVWETSELLDVRPYEDEPAIPLVPPWWTRAWHRTEGDWRDTVAVFAALFLVLGAGFGLHALARLLAAEGRTGLTTGFVAAIALIGLLVGTSLLIGSALRQLADGRWAPRETSPDPPTALAALVATATAAAWLWTVRPALHGLLMPLHQWPLVTWIPLVLGLLFTAVFVAAGRTYAGIVYRNPATLAAWGVFMILLPGWQGHALYAATVYVPADLPHTTQPRLLPKVAALAFASDASLHDAHLVVDPSSNRLVWSAEEATGTLRRGSSQRVVALALDTVTGRSQEVAGGFDPAVSRVGPGSLQWRAYKEHWFTRVQDAVLVPGEAGEAVAIAPYLRYTGFPVRHPVWAGVYVYHQDGRIEDLTPEQALARPELAGSGRLYPERLARAVAAAYGYKSGAGAALLRRSRTEIDDPPGNPQPYLTNLGDRAVRWVTVAHPAGDADTASAVFLTDAASGVTSVWRPPRDTRLLSNAGAAAITERLPLGWDTIDFNGELVWLRKVVEPTPVFADGRLYYVLSIVPHSGRLATTTPVLETVVVDAAARKVVRRYRDENPRASRKLMNFFDP
jgi:hypothetical protein